MRNGIYRDKNGKLVQLRRTSTGYVATYADGRTVAIGAAK